MARIVSGDDVLVITGVDKGKIGKVIKVVKRGDRVLAKVSSVALCKKSVKPTKEKEGGIFSMERFVDISNLAFYDADAGVGARIGYRFEDGKKVRYLKGSGRVLD